MGHNFETDAFLVLLLRLLKSELDDHSFNQLLEEVLKAKRKDPFLVPIDKVLEVYARLLAAKQCPFMREELLSAPLYCRLKQLRDVLSINQQAIHLVKKTKPYIIQMICGQPNKSLKYIARNMLVVRFKHLLQTRSGDVATFQGLFQKLIEEMTRIDKEMSGANGKLKPVFESFLRELAPKIDFLIGPYSTQKTFGSGQCSLCKRSTEIERDFMSEPCFQSHEEIERFFALSFRTTFYRELGEFVESINKIQINTLYPSGLG